MERIWVSRNYLVKLNEQEIQKLIEWAKKYGDTKIKELDLMAAEVKELI